MEDEIVPVDDLKRRIVLQEGMQNVGLIPTAFFFQYPLFEIFKRVQNVMYMDQHTGLEHRQDFKEAVIHIAISLADVGRIDEKDVILIQTLKHFQGHILQDFLQQASAQRTWFSEKVLNGVYRGVDECKVQRVVKEPFIGI